MKLIVTKNYDELSKVAAKEMADIIKNNPKAVLGLATGGSPIGMYKELIRMNKEGQVDFSQITTVNLDEYVGLSGEHNQSYRYFMNENLFNHININKENTFVPNGLAEDIEKECIDYDQKIAELGGTDVQLLGIGNNGHIAFNEPDNFLVAGTHLTGLTQNTIEANARFFDSIDEVPKTALTMGLGGIMKSRKIIVIASGAGKAEAVKEMLSGKIKTNMPASMLQMHKDVVLIVDEDAASLINR
ncbi:glucosamine-6-phosphate deaminase [Clostridium chauvoei]|uniref:Glucosamine-6-phosphate deaminase n=2 Tax=Clostridium chauvoei TaxID=46867 RepID=A0A1U6ITZ9_9CLOT|nr:glucosamine-6-phosphate deaminase [Clostridium chauvoei]ATD53910.1 glucosamine-6-phosphate deaminase [Clostridium chauvoei]ATD58285.1 glucosamine-6-phosphate deaminase [Clostridium chauvoei]MBX7280555.1 glucosamine-6-phosphate deaminase [Clostridium chauvoei]MBX7283117.1 glucosamine-6-phosphate deaminase [Clostridium chauvoei]MBX7285353.1 glucosamine-6-phosphate deaminase [Clostridium chauvoei]